MTDWFKEMLGTLISLMPIALSLSKDSFGISVSNHFEFNMHASANRGSDINQRIQRKA